MSCGSLTEQMNIYQVIILYFFHRKKNKQLLESFIALIFLITAHEKTSAVSY